MQLNNPILLKLYVCENEMIQFLSADEKIITDGLAILLI